MATPSNRPPARRSAAVLTEAHAALAKAPAAPPAAPVPDAPAIARAAAAQGQKLCVLDTTATADTGDRVHTMDVDGILKPFTFKPGEPLPLPPQTALKFLKHDAFKLCDEQGNLMPFRRRPKQPDELQAGEQLELADDETVARYDELSTIALQRRVLELAGSDRFAAANPDRKEMVRFIVETKQRQREANISREPDVGPGTYTPAAEADDEALVA